MNTESILAHIRAKLGADTEALCAILQAEDGSTDFAKQDALLAEIQAATEGLRVLKARWTQLPKADIPALAINPPRSRGVDMGKLEDVLTTDAGTTPQAKPMQRLQEVMNALPPIPPEQRAR